MAANSDQLFAALELVPAAVVVTDPAGTILFVNRRFEDLNGYSRDEVLGANPRILKSGITPSGTHADLWKVISGGGTWHGELCNRRKNGETYWAAASISPHHDGDGAIAYHVAVTQEVARNSQAEEALRASEERHRVLFEGSRDALMTLEPPDWNFTSCNPSTVEMFRARDKVGVTSVSPWTLSPPLQADGTESPVAAGRMIELALKQGSHSFEWQHRRLDGQVFHAEVLLTRMERAGGPFLQATVRDVTARKQAEEALHESRQKFASLNEAAFESIFLSEKGICLGQNRRAQELFGYSDEEAVGRPETDWIVPEDRDRVRKNILSGHELPYEATALRKDGSTVPVVVRGKMMQVKGKDVRVTSMSDITDRKRAENALAESEERYRFVANNTSDGILWLGADNTVKYASPAFLHLMGGRQSGSLPLDPEGILNRFHPDDRDATVARILAAIAARAPGLIYAYRARHAEGRYIWREDSARFQYDDEGNYLGVCLICRDVTERKRAEEDKAALEARLQQAEKLESVGRLAGGVAHDFNNVLGVILANTELAMEELPPEHPVRSELEEVLGAARRAAGLTRQLLTFARRQPIAPVALDLNATIQETLRMLRALIGENIRLTFKEEPDAWPVRMDPTQVDQILTNLCLNARDSIAGVGEVAIETRNHTFTDEECHARPGLVRGDFLAVSVRDNGCGMDKATLARVFEPFFSTKGVGKGTGLGLATVYGAVNQNGGFITVDSEPGKGTTFSIHFPRLKGNAGTRPGVAPIPAVGGGSETLLVVEDDPGILAAVTRMAAKLGYHVLAANSPAQAMAIARANAGRIHLLLTDVIMPDMNGRDLVNALRPICPGMRHLFMSGYPADVIAQHSVLDEGVNLIEKPFTQQDLAARLRATLERG